MEQQRVIAIGFFDGVHRGHGALLARARQVADRLGLPAAALTFDHHPASVLGGRAVPLLSTPEERAGLMVRLYGMDEVLICPFDRETAQMPWRSYVSDLLHRQYGAVHVVCGEDHRFGWRGEGDAVRLQQLCTRLGMGCDVIPKVEMGGSAVSSTRIRALLERGDVAGANALLGHPHCLTGRVVHGRQLGRQLGTPTANLLRPDGVLAPAYGVYATRVWVGERSYAAVANVGVRPTVDGVGAVTVEPWLLDFTGNLYDREVRVDFYEFLRPEQKFDGLDQLRQAILLNADQTRAYFAHREQPGSAEFSLYNGENDVIN